MSCVISPSRPYRGWFRWACTGIIFAISIHLSALDCVGQQSSRRVAPEKDGNTAAASTTDFSGVGFRTPRISLKRDTPIGSSDRIPTSESSRRGVTKTSGVQADGNRQQELSPTLAVARSDGNDASKKKSLRRNPAGNRSDVVGVNSEPDSVLGQFRIAKRQPEEVTKSSPSNQRAKIEQPFGEWPQELPPIVSSHQMSPMPPSSSPLQSFAPNDLPNRQVGLGQPVNLAPGNQQLANGIPPVVQPGEAANPMYVQARPGVGGSAADAVGNMQFMNAKKFLSQDSKPKFVDPKQFLAKPVPKLNKASTIKSQPARIAAQPYRRPIPRLVQDDTQQDLAESVVTEDLDDDGITEFSDVTAPISPVPFAEIYQNDTRDLLAKDADTDAITIYGGDQMNYAQLTGSPSVPSGKAWLAPNFYHRPLYFDETNLERYGNRLPLQVFASAAHFFVTIPKLPYEIGTNPPYQCTYTYGHQRPGDCVPYQIHRLPFNMRGVLNQALITSAVVLP